MFFSIRLIGPTPQYKRLSCQISVTGHSVRIIINTAQQRHLFWAQCDAQRQVSKIHASRRTPHTSTQIWALGHFRGPCPVPYTCKCAHHHRHRKWCHDLPKYPKRYALQTSVMRPYCHCRGRHHSPRLPKSALLPMYPCIAAPHHYFT